MNFLNNNVNEIVSIFVIIGLVVWNIYNSIQNRKSSDLADENNALGIMSKEIEAHKIKIANLEGNVHELSKQVTNKDSIIAEKDKQIAMMKEMFENRNPELQNILIEIRDFMKEIRNTNKHQTDILETQVKEEKNKK